MKCDDCSGTRLRRWGQYHKKALYTEEECLSCGGKGYIREGEREYSVELFSDSVRLHQFFVIGRTAAEALFLASEMFMGTQAAMIRRGEEVALIVTEQ